METTGLDTAAAAGMGILSIISLLVTLVGLVCWILEIVAAFKKEQSPLMGILSIVLCAIGGFIIGWINARKWGIQTLMIVWTIVVVLSIILSIMSGGIGFSMGTTTTTTP